MLAAVVVVIVIIIIAKLAVKQISSCLRLSSPALNECPRKGG